jgi:hypothetical protein
LAGNCKGTVEQTEKQIGKSTYIQETARLSVNRVRTREEGKEFA